MYLFCKNYSMIKEVNQLEVFQIIPNLYLIVNKEQLEDMLNTFNQCLGIPIHLLDKDGNVLMAFGTQKSYCSLIQKKVSISTCMTLHAKASQKAMDIGEPYIFFCHAGMNHIVFPLVNQKTLFGSILAGPFSMDEPDSLLFEELAKRFNFTTSELLELYDESKEISILPTAKVTYLSKMLYYMFAGLISDSKQQLRVNQHKLHQQSRINESIQMYKTGGLVEKTTYPYEKELMLITKLKVGDNEGAKILLNDLLGYVFFSEGNNLEVLKSRSLELCALLSRAEIESGATSDNILKVNNQLMSIIPNVQEMEELCYKLQAAIDAFTHCMGGGVPTKNSELVKKAIHYISQNFAAELTLESVASHVNLNPSFFSTMFKQSTGYSFKEYLNMVRIEESKRLLANTDYSLIDIAVATGFEDQSYFSKVFKKYTGLTPRQYR